VVALLSSRPHTWLRVFLRLASSAATAPGIAAVADTRAWYRLGTPTQNTPDEVSVPFVWRPQLGIGLFTRFKGRLVVHPQDGGTALSLDGDTVGGISASNLAVLQRLLELLAAAVSADQEVGG
jgi:hypothetical protein